jgi:hypothetical protein
MSRDKVSAVDLMSGKVSRKTNTGIIRYLLAESHPRSVRRLAPFQEDLPSTHVTDLKSKL